jgi:hypothetical protein
MKLVDTTSTIKQNNITGAASFTMKSSRKAFQILSDLYSDKPLAIVRELGCNATDAMTAAGKQGQPFHIHLPNSLEPWMTIQDYGTGISPENIYSIYSTYFESTKTNTNEQIGCLGLGSKSPFCYTDNFSVTSIYDGEKRVYNAYFNEQNTPTIALMSATPTTEGNGMAIQIPVKPNDFQKFKEAVVSAFRFFDLKPTISGDSIVWKEEKPMFFGDDWMFLDSNSSYEAYAIMGGVTYPIENRHLDEKYNSIVRKGIVLKFAIGELDFAPSREHLSYDEHTIKALNDKLAKVLKELKGKVKDMIVAKPNILEAMRAVQYFNDRFSYYGSSSFELKDVKYNGHDITSPHKLLKVIAPKAMHYYRRSYRKMLSESTGFNLDTKYGWFYDEGTTKNPVNRLKTFVRETDTYCHLFDKESYDALINLGIPADTFTQICTLPSPSMKRKMKNGVVVQKQKEDITCYHMGETYNVSWEGKVYEPADKIPSYYILKGKTWDVSFKANGFRNLNDKHDLMRILSGLGIARTDVVMIAPRTEKDVKARGSKSLLDHVNAMDFSWINVNEIATIERYGNSYAERIVKMPEFKSLSNDNPVKILLEKVASYQDKYKGRLDLIKMRENLNTGKAETLACPARQFVAETLSDTWQDDTRKGLISVAKALENN